MMRLALNLTLAAAMLCLASCQSSDDRAWADYSRGVNHVLKQ